MMRPQPARWFEVLTARDDVAALLAALGDTGAVELETRGARSLPQCLAVIAPKLGRFQELAARYRAYWPQRDLEPSPVPESPALVLDRAIARLSAWAADAEPLILDLQRGEAEEAELRLWRDLLPQLGPARFDPGQLAEAGPLLDARLFVFAPRFVPSGPLPFAGETLALRAMIGESLHLLVVAPAPAMATLVREAAALRAREHRVPPWLKGTADETAAFIERRLAELRQESLKSNAALESLHRQHGLHQMLGDVGRIEWVLHNVRALETDEWLAHVTGWTSDADGARLSRALDASGARALLHFPPPPADREPPLVLRNPAWVRPFEIFARALGMPARHEADPSRLLAVSVPLMFGYMFGDLGQGLVLAATAFALRRRWPLARLFIAGGLSAALFGLLFGGFFARHDLLPALWLHPLDEPLTILIVPLAAGALLLLAGLAFGGLGAAWRGEARHWWLAEAGLVGVYVGLLAGFLHPLGWWLAAAGAVGAVAGPAWLERRAGAAAAALGTLIEHIQQLLINTLSFARVGAFALAHAGLSAAIVALSQAADGGTAQWLLLVLGNALVIVLETLVVSIQTTRLVLFEFFTRFLTAGGRPFRPLPPPPHSPLLPRET
ncbi:MAG: ATPase [Betaproteobacteria bacterium]|nr:ATPase [Betaproteobacteria bacterium]